MEKVKIVEPRKVFSHMGTLKLWARIQVERSPEWDSHAYRRLTLQTIHGVLLEDDKEKYIAEFKDLNPSFKDLAINFEFTIKQFG
jgi:hypothetical protein